jgi:hypothetical protein
MIAQNVLAGIKEDNQKGSRFSEPIKIRTENINSSYIELRSMLI